MVESMEHLAKRYERKTTRIYESSCSIGPRTCLVVLRVVYLHDLAADRRFQLTVVVGEVR